MKHAEYLSYRDCFFDEITKTLKAAGYKETNRATVKDLRRLNCFCNEGGVTRSVVVDVPFYWKGSTRGITVSYEVTLQNENEDFSLQFEHRNIGKENFEGEINYYKIKTFLFGTGQVFYSVLYSEIKKAITEELIWLDDFDSLEKLIFYLKGNFEGARGQIWPYLNLTGDLGRAHRSTERKTKLIEVVEKLIRDRDAGGKDKEE
ncbi:MAG: hypothetical protein L3J39_17365 [Verrucomicrobiales bacterium]|nr:hypothetical protein [Verrucomicrobiales bacterium]